MTRSQVRIYVAQAIEALRQVDKNIRAIVLFGGDLEVVGQLS